MDISTKRLVEFARDKGVSFSTYRKRTAYLTAKYILAFRKKKSKGG